MSTTITIEVPDTFAGLSEGERRKVVEYIEQELAYDLRTAEYEKKIKAAKELPESEWVNIPAIR